MLSDLIYTQVWNALGYSIIQFLWQGAAIGLFTYLLLKWNTKSNATTRHSIACSSLFVSLLVLIATFILSLNDFNNQTIYSTSSIETNLLTSNSTYTNGYSFFLLISICWLIGIFLMSIRYVRQFAWSINIKSNGTSMPETQWMKLLDGIKIELGIKRTVHFLQSAIADTPMVIGWLSPVIIVPTSIFTSMSHDQIRAILTHELSHIQRCDHIINFTQTLAEVILFFHPAIWWISKQIRNEREYCCDDVTLRTVKQPKILAEALLQLELLRTSHTHKQAALAANGGSLMTRITRLLRKQNNNTHHAWKAPLSFACLALIATVSVGASNFQANADETTKKDSIASIEEETSNARTVFMLKITDALIEGKLSPADAAKKMISFDEGVVEKAEYLHGIQQKLDHAVDSGEMTREEADAKYGEFYKNKKENSGNERAKAYLNKVGTEIKEAIANGTMTSEEGKAKYAGAEARIEKRMSQKNVGNKRLEAYLAKIGTEIKEAVAKGEMSPEEGKEKYTATVEAVKQRMMASKSNGQSKQITKEEYDEAAAKMARKVKAGEITHEQMQNRLEAIGRKLKESMRGGDRNEISDDCMKLRRQLGEAVRSGEMTREESGKIWEEEGC